MRPTLVVVALLAVVAGCQLVLATDRVQCVTDADCVGRSAADLECREAACVPRQAPVVLSDAASDAAIDRTAPWWCLPSPPERPGEDRGQSVLLRQRYAAYSLNDCEYNQPVPGAQVKLCSQRDVTCGSPVETAFTDCAGYVNFKAVYRGFEGFVIVTPPKRAALDGGSGPWPADTTACFEELAAKEAAEGRSGERCAVKRDTEGRAIVQLPDDLVPSVRPIVPPPSVSSSVDADIPLDRTGTLLSAGTLRSLLGVIGKPLDPTAGHLTAVAYDCNGQLTAGVSISVAGGIGPNSQVYYTDPQGLPNVNQGETASTGDTGYMNLDVGATGVDVVSVTATRRATGERIGAYAALVRSGHVTYLEMPPVRN